MKNKFTIFVHKNFFIMTVAQVVYMVNDEIKTLSDDATYTEAHILFLLNKYRSYLLKRQYDKDKGSLSISNTQTICINLEDYSTFGDSCVGNYRRSTDKIPNLLFKDSARMYPTDFTLGVNFALVPYERLPFVGHNKYLKSIIYCAIGPDHYLYFDSDNPQHTYLEKVNVTGVFEDLDEALALSCNAEGESCDPMEKEFPIQDDLVPELIQGVVKELLGATYRPKDYLNSASDDLAALATFLRNNTKSALQKQIDGDPV